MKFGLQTKEWDLITGACSRLPEIEEAILFGSRAKGNFKRGSDVDLSIKGENVTRTTALKLQMELNEELPLPYFFDVVSYAAAGSQDLRPHIDRVGKVIYRRGSTVCAEEGAPDTSEGVKDGYRWGNFSNEN